MKKRVSWEDRYGFLEEWRNQEGERDEGSEEGRRRHGDAKWREFELAIVRMVGLRPARY
jgi:hypothetical protein